MTRDFVRVVPDHLATGTAGGICVRKLVATLGVLLTLLLSAVPASAHGGGLDGNGGHHCREAGYNSGKCGPLNSYHCHSAGCTQPGAQQQPVVATPPPTEAPTTTEPPTTTTEPPTTTTQPPITTTEPPTTTTSQAVIEVEQIADEAEADEANPFVGFGVLGAIGYGGYRVYRRFRPKNAA